MEDIITILITLLKKEYSNYTLLSIIVFFIFYFIFFFIKNIDAFINLSSSFKKDNKLDIVNITNSKTDIEIQELINTRQFEKHFGIYIEKKRRELLIDFHKNHEIQISWKLLKSAYSFMIFEENNVVIKIPKIDLVLFYFNLVLFVLFTFIAISLFLYSIHHGIKFFSLAILIFIIGAFMLRINNNLMSALTIKNYSKNFL